MNYGYEKIQNGDKSLSETIDTDKRNTHSAGIDFSWQLNQKSKLFLNSTGEFACWTWLDRDNDKGV